MQLFSSASACHASGSHLDAAAILLAGQERALTDLALLAPADEAAMQRAAELYQFVYFKAGGFGYDEILRSESSLKTVFHVLEAWQPGYSESYDPGWDIDRYPSAEKYLAQFSYSTNVRRIQLEHLALLERDPEYRKLDDERQALLHAHNNVIQDPETSKKYAELSQKLQEITAKYPEPEIPEQPDILRFEYEPDPNAGFRQLLSGLNGPDVSGTEVFRSQKELQESWLINALNAGELGEIERGVEFDDEVIMVISVGGRANASGRIVVTEARYSEETAETQSAIMVGVYPKKCGVSEASHFPFAVVAVAREQGRIGRSEYLSNFPDTCPSDTSLD